MASDTEMKKTYDDFSPENYCIAMEKNFAPEVDFYLENLHKFFNSVSFENGKCLEFGSGPTFHSVLSASRRCSCIVACEFNKDNREALKKWIRADNDALRFLRFLQTVVRLEGYQDFEEGSRIICNRLRSCYKGVFHCDALAEIPVPPEAGNDFDIIISSLCLEAATLALDAFAMAIQKIGSLLKSQGSFLLMGVLQQTFWFSGNDKYPSLYLTKQYIEDSLRSAGFGDFRWSSKDGISSTGTCDASGIFFIIATKN